MNNKIFKSSFLTTLFVLIATIALIMGVLFDFFEDQIQKEIEINNGIKKGFAMKPFLLL